MIYFRDVKNKPSAEYWHDMKFWWPHNETIIATLLAYQITGDPKYAAMAPTRPRLGLQALLRSAVRRVAGLCSTAMAESPLISKAAPSRDRSTSRRQEWYCWKLTEELLAKALKFQAAIAEPSLFSHTQQSLPLRQHPRRILGKLRKILDLREQLPLHRDLQHLQQPRNPASIPQILPIEWSQAAQPPGTLGTPRTCPRTPHPGQSNT